MTDENQEKLMNIMHGMSKAFTEISDAATDLGNYIDELICVIARVETEKTITFDFDPKAIIKMEEERKNAIN